MYIFVFLSVSVLLYIAYTDFYEYKIKNNQIFAMISIFLIWKLYEPDGFFWLDLGIGVALFLVGFVAWLLKGIGAGDAKLFFVAGIFSGYQYAGYFAIFLLVTGLIFVLLMLIAKRLDFLPVVVFGRLIEIGKVGKIPYGVPLAMSTIGTLVMRLSLN